MNLVGRFRLPSRGKGNTGQRERNIKDGDRLPLLGFSNPLVEIQTTR